MAVQLQVRRRPVRGAAKPTVAVRTPAGSYDAGTGALTEAVLVRLWAGQRFPGAALVTRTGAPVRVIHPGFAGRGPGPDFRDAIVARASGPLLRGDVELHVRASDFNAHGHAADSRYNNVVLHVVFEDDRGEDTGLACGRCAPVVALGDWVRRRTREIEGWLASPTLWREPCHDAAARLGEQDLLALLDGLGDERFREREAALLAEVARHGPAETLYRALLSGLGYGGLRGAFDAIADALPWSLLGETLALEEEGQRALGLQALLLGAARLLPPPQRVPARDPHERELLEHWRAGGIEPLPVPLSGGSARPANHPARRLAGLAVLLARHAGCVDAPQGMLGAADEPVAALVAAWIVPAHGYWRRCLAPGHPAARPPGAPIGRSRAVELLTNGVLPWAAALAEAQGRTDTAGRARALYAELPRPARYGALSFLETNLRLGQRPLPLDARRQQGLLALYKSECTQGGCGRCALS
jgi:hypothetical protein